MLILIHYNFLTISEILKEKKNQTNNKKPNQKNNPKEKELQVPMYTQNTDHSF